MVNVKSGSNHAIHTDINALHTDIDVMSASGTASNQLVHESLNVSKYLGFLFPSAGFNEPNISIWAFVNRFVGTGKSLSGRFDIFSFEDCYAKHFFHQAWPSFSISRQKYHVKIIRVVVLIFLGE